MRTKSITALAMQAAGALDSTHDVGERGPKTLQARNLLAAWLDTGRGSLVKVRAAIRWLKSVKA
jgi:hypothetical protein